MPDIIDQILANEDKTGTGVVSNNPSDSGGKTQWGLTEKDNPKEWADGIVTRNEARKAFEKRYLFPFQSIPDPNLQHQVVDFAVNAGPDAAARVLQQILNVSVDGHVGPQTVAAINNFDSGKLYGVTVPGFVLLNLAFRDARVLFYAGLVKRFPKNLAFLLGWLRRALEFK